MLNCLKILSNSSLTSICDSCQILDLINFQNNLTCKIPTQLKLVKILGGNTLKLLTSMQKTLHSLASCLENFPLIQISSILSVNFTSLWHRCRRVFWWASCTPARHAGSFDCLMTILTLITMDNGRWHCAYWQSCKVPNQTHRGKKWKCML